MLGELVPNNGGGLVGRVPNSLSREIARIDGKALAFAAKVRAAHFVGDAALLAVAQLSCTQGEAEKLAPPSAALRLAVIGDGITASIQALVLRLGSEL